MKRIFPVLLAFILLISCTACSVQARPDIMTFSKRLANINELYGFDYSDMFIYENVYHTYLSLCEKDDVMLSFTLAQNSNIENITITVFNDSINSEEAKQEVRKFFNSCIDSFASLTEKETQERDNSMSYNNTEIYFTDIYETFSALRYNFIFSSNPTYMCLYCEYYEEMSIN